MSGVGTNILRFDGTNMRFDQHSGWDKHKGMGLTILDWTFWDMTLSRTLLISPLNTLECLKYEVSSLPELFNPIISVAFGSCWTGPKMYQLKSSERLIVIYVIFIIIKDLFTLYILMFK